MILTYSEAQPGGFNPVDHLRGAVKRLFSRKNSGDIDASNCLLAFVAYTVLNVGMTGVPVPSGNFTGTMLIGGLVGRLVGALVRSTAIEGLAASGVYAMVGSAAMLCGFKQISMAVVVFIVEAGCDLSLGPPLMLSITISLILNQVFLHRGFDEEQIARKSIPFLPAEPPVGMEHQLARDILDFLPTAAILPVEASPMAVQNALDQEEILHFPVLRDGKTCVGFTTRARLEAVMNPIITEEHLEALASQNTQLSVEFPGLHTNRKELSIGAVADTVPYMILEDAPILRFYGLFAKCGAAVACVVTDTGEFRGMISRTALIGAARRAEEGPEEHDLDETPSGDDDSPSQSSHE